MATGMGWGMYFPSLLSKHRGGFRIDCTVFRSVFGDMSDGNMMKVPLEFFEHLEPGQTGQPRGAIGNGSLFF